MARTQREGREGKLKLRSANAKKTTKKHESEMKDGWVEADINYRRQRDEWKDRNRKSEKTNQMRNVSRNVSNKKTDKQQSFI